MSLSPALKLVNKNLHSKEINHRLNKTSWSVFKLYNVNSRYTTLKLQFGRKIFTVGIVQRNLPTNYVLRNVHVPLWLHYIGKYQHDDLWSLQNCNLTLRISHECLQIIAKTNAISSFQGEIWHYLFSIGYLVRKRKILN